MSATDAKVTPRDPVAKRCDPVASLGVFLCFLFVAERLTTLAQQSRRGPHSAMRPLHQLVERAPDFLSAERAVPIAMDILLHEVVAIAHAISTWCAYNCHNVVAGISGS